jgi:Fructose-1-6-bisphosphatase, C-terminal domain
MMPQGGGVFCNPCSAAAPAKLRLLYECAPLALVVEVRACLVEGLTRSITPAPLVHAAVLQLGCPAQTSHAC